MCRPKKPEIYRGMINVCSFKQKILNFVKFFSKFPTCTTNLDTNYKRHRFYEIFITDFYEIFITQVSKKKLVTLTSGSRTNSRTYFVCFDDRIWAHRLGFASHCDIYIISRYFFNSTNTSSTKSYYRSSIGSIDFFLLFEANGSTNTLFPMITLL